MFSKFHKLCFQYAVNKSFAEDLTEGKFSFPTIHAIKTSPNNTEIISILFTTLISCLLCLCDNIFPRERTAVSTLLTGKMLLLCKFKVKNKLYILSVYPYMLLIIVLFVTTLLFTLYVISFCHVVAIFTWTTHFVNMNHAVINSQQKT